MTSGGYYDIDAILATQQKLPCTFRLDVPGLGFLESEETHDIKEGQRVELPYWLAELLGIRETLDIGRPKMLSAGVCNALKASPRHVDLRGQSTHFYAAAAKYLDWSDRPDQLAQVIIETFRSRVTKLADHAHEPAVTAAAGPKVVAPADLAFLRGLDELERSLFKMEYDSINAVNAWMTRSRDI
ncbi:DNA replication protein [Savitreella phatthalungensis]